MSIKKIQAIARKEFYHVIRDFRSLYLAFLFPIILILLFGYALSLDVENVEVVVVDHDQTEFSRLFIDKLDASSYFHVQHYLPKVKDVIEYLDHGWTIMGIIIPPDWTENIKAGREAELQILLDGSDPNTANLARGYITAFISGFNQKLLLDFLDRKGLEQIKPPIDGRIRVWFNEDLESRNFIVPGIIAIIIMIVGAVLTSLVIAREYENGTMETLRTLPLEAEEFLIGKAIPYFFIALIDVLVAVLMGQVLFDVVMKSNFWLLILATCLYLFVALSLGLLISAGTKSQLVANQVAVLATYLPSLLLSDFVFPITNMPKVLQVVTYIVPATYFIDILNGLYLRGVGLKYLWKSFLVLLIMVIILLALNVRKLKGEKCNMNWIRVREFVRKEFIQLFRDRKNRPLVIILPIIQLLIFGYVASSDVRDIRVGFLDQANTVESRMVKDGFDANKTFRITHVFNNTRDLEETLLKRNVDLTVTVWPDFSDRIKKGQSAPLQIFADGSRSNMAAVRIAYTSLVLDKINQDLLKKIHPEKIDYGRIDERLRTWYNPNLDSQNFFIPGLVAFIILLTTLLFTSIAIIRERETGTMEQLIVTPIKPYELILEKTIPYVIIAFVQLIIVMLIAIFWFDIPFKGSVLLVFASACLFLLSTIGIGLFISTVSSTQQQAAMTTFFFMLPFFLLSGLVFPVANMPVAVQWFTHIIPLRFFLVIIRGGFLKGVGFEILWSEMLHLLIIGGVVFFLAVRRFRKRLD